MNNENNGANGTGANEEDKNINNENQGNQNDNQENQDNDNENSNQGDNNKTVETPEQKYARLKRQTEQLGKKLGIDSDKSSKSSKASELDYGQKAFLVASGVKGAKEMDLAKEYMSNTGKSLEEVVENKYFLNDLKELRETTASANAMPNGSKRSTNSSKDSVDYWLAKGELPPADQIELRRKVVNERIAKEKNKNVFGPGR